MSGTGDKKYCFALKVILFSPGIILLLGENKIYYQKKKVVENPQDCILDITNSFVDGLRKAKKTVPEYPKRFLYIKTECYSFFLLISRLL